MRKYLLSLLSISLLLVVASFVVMWFVPEAYIVAMSLLVVYFAALTAIQHLIVTRSLHKSPRSFVQIFFGTTIGMLIVHLLLIIVFMFTNTAQVKPFLIAFIVCFVVYLAFETIALVRYVDDEKKRRGNQ